MQILAAPYSRDFSPRKFRKSGTPKVSKRKLLDIREISKLGWAPKYTLREGLELTYNWFKENYPNVKGCNRNLS